LRLAIGRDGIGLELASPVFLECVVVEEMTTSLPGVRFPVDVSGGVARFRHRRGALQSLRLAVSARVVERWLAPRLRGIVSATSPDVWIGMGTATATVCISGPPEDAGSATSEPRTPWAIAPAVAFEVLALADAEDIELVVRGARGAGLPAPPTAMAIACVGAALGRSATRSGAIFRIRRPAEAAARALLPDAGARVPSAGGVRWSAFSVAGDAWIVSALEGATSAEPSADAVRAREIARHLHGADDALVHGDEALARTLYLAALERVPRHAEVVRRIADIDARTSGRAEAALAAIAEATVHDAAPGASDLVEAELLVRAGDVEKAIARLERGGTSEVAPVLAARSFEMAARLAADPEVQGGLLDRALARSPRVATARWSRVAARLSLGRLEDALADVESLEALARGRASRARVWLRAGRAWQAAGLAERAGAVFERALRYEPDDVEALTGLGLALAATGRAARGAAVIDRALALAQARGEPPWSAALALATTLADKLDDLPAAIAHAGSVPSDASEGALARGLEGRWRRRLGDVAGAALAYARLRDLATSRATAGVADAEIVAFLAEAARMEVDVRRDLLAAQRHLAAALHLAPHDPELRRAYRDIGAQLLGRASPREDSRAAPSLAFEETPDRAALAEDLARRLQAHPGDEAIAGELAQALEDLGRGHELVALLGARLDETTPEQRPVVAAWVGRSLERLRARAAHAGREDLVALCADALDAFGLDPSPAR
jgi:tetratricopeptide (TPR) repeat protein